MGNIDSIHAKADLDLSVMWEEDDFSSVKNDLEYILKSKSSPEEETDAFSDKLIGELLDEVQNLYTTDAWSDEAPHDKASIKDSDAFEDNSISLNRKGNTKNLFKAEIVEQSLKYLSKEAAEVFTELGPFKYRESDITEVLWDDSNLEIRDVKGIKNWYYFGQWNRASNLREGRGIAVYLDGSIYEGIWKNGKKHGSGRLIFESGDVYQGHWEKDLQSGYGVLKSRTSKSMKGWWKEGKLHGDGFEIRPDGTEYRGSYKKGSQNGKGHLKLENGNQYDGEFKDGKPEGEGVYKWNDGNEYIGTLKAGKITGKGTFKYSSLSNETEGTYTGEFLDGEKSGFGEFISTKGIKYVGYWLKNQFNGLGEYTDKDGKVMSGLWKNGEFCKKK